MSTRTALDPVRRLPRSTTVVRAVAVIALLLAAVWVLDLPDTAPDRPAAEPTAQHSPATPSVAEATAGPHRAATAAPPVPAASGASVPGIAARDPGTGADHGFRLPVPDGLVGVPVPLGVPATTALVRPGDLVDLLAVPASDEPVTIAEHAAVLGVDRPDATVLLALTREQARLVVATPDPFALIVRS